MSKLFPSWVASANSADTDFPLNNLPCGVFSSNSQERHCGVAIGDQILDVAALERKNHIDFGGSLLCGDWRNFMAMGKVEWARLRSELTRMLAAGSTAERHLLPHLLPIDKVTLHMPFTVTEFTDFYSCRHHATNVGTMFRGTENALPPNWLYIPIGYNGRASSVVVSGTDVVRPHGQLKAPDDEAPRFAPSKRFDIELELGAIVGQASEEPLSVVESFDNIFGFVLLNDWSARDIQAWEYQPLGPFQAKATATTISAWIVTAAALEPFRVSTPAREKPLPEYLEEPAPMLYDISLEVGLTPHSGTETILCKTNANELYYSAAQQLAHHSSSGCPMRCGDLLGSGTISGEEKNSRGSLLELSWGGKDPIILDCGESRRFIEDNDLLSLRGASIGADYRIGFGSCEGRVIAARNLG